MRDPKDLTAEERARDATLADLTPEEIAQDTALCEAATPGPWYWWMSEKAPYVLGSHSTVDIGVSALMGTDAAFIATARTGYPRALAMVERLATENKKLLDALIELSANCDDLIGPRTGPRDRARALIRELTA